MPVNGVLTTVHEKTKATAEKILAFLNSAAGKAVERILIGYSTAQEGADACGVEVAPRDANPFWAMIKDATLADGRPAASVIINKQGHCGHFHVVINPGEVQ